MTKSTLQDRLPIPENLNPELICFKIYLPDDPQYIQTFVGKLRELCLWTGYDRDEEKRGTIVAGVWKQVIETLQPCETDCGCDESDSDCFDCGDCGDCT